MTGVSSCLLVLVRVGSHWLRLVGVGLGCCWLIGAEWRTPSYRLLADEPLTESAPPQQETKVTLSQLAGLWDSLPSRIARQHGLLVMLHQCKRAESNQRPQRPISYEYGPTHFEA